MSAALLERPGTTTAEREFNHSCTSQCPNPCPASHTKLAPSVVTERPTPVAQH